MEISCFIVGFPLIIKYKIKILKAVDACQIRVFNIIFPDITIGYDLTIKTSLHAPSIHCTLFK